MVDKIEIRAPREVEREQVFQVYETGLPNVDVISHEEFLSWWTRCKENGTMESLWRVAVVDGELVGVVMNFISESLNWGFIWELSVLPGWRNKGIGESLVRDSQLLLLNERPHLSQFALGAKTHNQRVLSLYERLGYGIRFIVIRLKGPASFAENGGCALEPAAVDHIVSLKQLKPDVYWNNKDQDGWIRAIQSKEAYIARKSHTDDIIGFLRFTPDVEFNDATAVDFACTSECCLEVIKSASDRAKTSSILFWVQDNHQEALEYLYDHSFQRVDSEYLLLKKPTLHLHR